MKPGTKIEFVKEAIALMEAYSESLRLQSFAVERLFQSIRESEKRFFDQIRELHPELNGYHFRINYDDNTITVMHKTED